MSSERRRNPGSDHAENVLRAELPHASAATARAVRALGAPGHLTEVAGHAEALAAFRAAMAQPVPDRPTLLARLLTLKAGLALIVATAVCGAGLAAADGDLPVPHKPHHPPAVTEEPVLRVKSARPQPPPVHTPAATPSATPAATPAPPVALPSIPAEALPAVAEMCRYLLRHMNGDEPGGWKHDRAAQPGPSQADIDALIRAAGGRKNVRRYCTTLLERDDRVPNPPNYPGHP